MPEHCPFPPLVGVLTSSSKRVLAPLACRHVAAATFSRAAMSTSAPSSQFTDQADRPIDGGRHRLGMGLGVKRSGEAGDHKAIPP
jgi:hypothetical protein